MLFIHFTLLHLHGNIYPSIYQLIYLSSIRNLVGCVLCHLDAAPLLQSSEGTRDRQKEEQLHHRAAGEGVWTGGLGLPELCSGAHQQQRAVPGDGVGQQHAGGLLPGGLVQPGAGLSLPRR